MHGALLVDGDNGFQYVPQTHSQVRISDLIAHPAPLRRCDDQATAAKTCQVGWRRSNV